VQLARATIFASALTSVGLIGSSAFASPLTPGDLLVYQVGNGTSTSLSGTSAPAFLDEYTTGGALVEQIAVPSTSVAGGNQALTESGSASSDGLLTLSPNGQCVTFTGYDTAVGTASVVSSTVNRTVGIIGQDGVVNTSTAASIDLGNNIRSAVTTNGQQLWTAGAGGGVNSLTAGSSNATATPVESTSARQVTVFNNQLYFDTSSALSSLGTGLPTSSATAMALPGVSTGGNPYGFLFESLNPADHGAADTLYIADDSSGVVKYSLVSGTWVKTGSVGSGTNGFTDLTAQVVNDVVDLYAISNDNQLVALTDSSGYDGTFASSITTLVTADSHETFNGVADAPVPLPPGLPLFLSGLVGLALIQRRRAA
jgi:hypothetical protein